MTAADYKVLLGDDDPAMLRLLSRWLERAGYPTRTAADGQEALEAVELECPDFVITDWEMPRINGLELCRRVREMALPHYVYILFLTAKTTPAEMIAGWKSAPTSSSANRYPKASCWRGCGRVRACWNWNAA